MTASTETNLVPGYYCNQAIDDFLATERHFSKIQPDLAKRYRQIAELLRQAVKFVLPDCGELLDRHALSDNHLDLLHLPYPVIALEASWLNATVEADPAVSTRSTRRIALCWEHRVGFEPISGCTQGLEPEAEGVFVLPVFYADEQKAWGLGAGGIFIPRDYREFFATLTPEQQVASAAANKVSVSQVSKSGKGRFPAVPFIALPQAFHRLVEACGGDLMKASQEVLLNARDEAATVVQACAVLNCSNVEMGEVKPSKSQNAARAARGKLPLFTYKVLQVSAQKGEAGDALGGTHASPRTHLRRGHIRRLSQDRLVWVRATLVNASATHGVVAKSYQVNP